MALAGAAALPERASGVALFADISGFTSLTEMLAAELGPQRGAETLTELLSQMYGALIAPIDLYRGSVISFSGDAITCWFGGDDGRRALTAALAMQNATRRLASFVTPGGYSMTLAVKVAVVAGPVRRFSVGDPQYGLIDVLAGRTLDALAAAEHLAERGEIVLDVATAARLAAEIELASERAERPGGLRVAIVAGVRQPARPDPWPDLARAPLAAEQVRRWLPVACAERLERAAGAFAAELRPAAALFLAFGGIDYDEDEDAAVMLDALIRRVQHLAAVYGGTLLQLTIGDKGSYLYLAFGAPVSHDDDAARAVACARELILMTAQLGFVADVRAGIARGMMYAGAYGSDTRRTYGVLGDATNLAARLMQAAPLGEVRCDAPTTRAARRSWVFEALVPLRLKGKAAAVAVYRPLRQANAPSAPGTPDASGAAPLIGRSHERLALADQVSALGAGHGGLLLIAGEAGIGKSRLMAELAALATAEGASVLAGRGHSIEQHTPYRAWRDVIAALLDLELSAPPEAQREQARLSVAALAPRLAQRTPLLNDVLPLDLAATPLTNALEGALRQESLFGLLATLMAERARSGPLAILLDDAHWLDSVSLDLVRHVARAISAAAVPVVLALALRPAEETAAAAAIQELQAQPGARLILPGALAAHEIDALALARLGLPPGGLPTQAAAVIREQSAGNPFFAEELAATMLDRGIISIEQADGDLRCRFDASSMQAHVALPDTLQGLVLARIDRLPPEQQFTLKVAAVIGRSFAEGPLRATLERFQPDSAATLHTQLAELVRRELTRLELAEPELSYVFRHIMTQEVAYQTLLYAQRREIHQAVGGWFERVYADRDRAALAPIAPVLAYHYHLAENGQRERVYARLAGEEAARRYANAEARSFLDRAIELTPADQLNERLELLLLREQVANLQGDRATQLHDLEHIAALADRLADDAWRAEALLRRAEYAELTGDYPGALAHAQQALALAEGLALPAVQIKALVRRGRVQFLQSEFGQARSTFEQAHALAHDSTAEADILRNLSLVALNQSDYQDATMFALRALERFQRAGNRVGESAALGNIAAAAYFQGDYAAARRAYEQILANSRIVGDRLGESDALGNLGAVAREQGDYLRAREYFRQAVAACRMIDNRWGEAAALNGLGNVALAQGQYDAARRFQEDTLALSRAIGYRLFESIALVNLAEAWTATGAFEQAYAAVAEGLHQFHEAGDRRNESWALAVQALALLLAGQAQSAAQAAEAGAALAREVGARAEEGLALTMCGRAREALGRPDAGQAYQQAVALWHELGEHRLSLDAHAGLARLALASGDAPGARQAIQPVLAFLALAESLDGTGEPILIALTCVRALAAVHDRRGTLILERSYQVLTDRARAIADDTLRSQFLTRMAAHRELEALWLQHTESK
jgi:predicted ATPase/class 3 adenylate cyclase